MLQCWHPFHAGTHCTELTAADNVKKILLGYYVIDRLSQTARLEPCYNHVITLTTLAFLRPSVRVYRPLSTCSFELFSLTVDTSTRASYTITCIWYGDSW